MGPFISMRRAHTRLIKPGFLRKLDTEAASTSCRILVPKLSALFSKDVRYNTNDQR